MKARDIKGSKTARIIERRGQNLPNTIHARYQWTETEDPWLEASEDVEALAEKGETIYVGEYKLVKVREITLELKIA